ncbi:MAG: M28 family peptidase [Ignavibacteriales bacterium]|nr:M28 family peptidase [Ignavibacteriales bacterium]
MRLSCLIVVLAICSQLTIAQNQKTDWESMFRGIPSPERQREYMQRLSARPHHVGSAYDKDNAQWLLSTFKQWGLNARIESFDVLFPTPKERLVELLEPRKFTATMEEPREVVDITSGQRADQLPTYNVYSVDGDVAAPLVYVNYGIPEDYEQLERMGISVKGCIVIARYGGSWRGIKPKVAAEKGTIGCLIYSDPKEDGYYHGDVFPEGPWRPKDGVQRGSVMDMPIYPGDPLTPGVGATAGAKRIPLKEAKTITKIPVLPISYADAQPLLAELSGPVAPESWRGALPITYKIGPGPAKVHLKIKSNWDTKTINDVIVTIPGALFPDEWVIRGNHHDAWVNGAEDPISGLVAEMEELRGLSELLKKGWKPKRTIVYCAWDGEEEGLLGSTEWAETHAAELKQKAALYINSDANGRGFLGVEGSHSLEQFINGVARDIEDPEKKITVWKRSQLQRIKSAPSPEDRTEARTRPDLHIGALGSGSDYTAFLDYLGIASLNLGYGGEDGGGIYHSIYDDFYWFTHFGDTDFAYGRALAQTAGTAVLRFADADVLPYEFTNLNETIRHYLDDVKRLLKSMQNQIKERNREITEGVFSAIDDPKHPLLPPPTEEEPPYLNFAPLDNAVDALSRSADHYEKAAKRIAHAFIPPSPEALKAINGKLLLTERALTHPDGLPGRPWFKHLLYAPGAYTGYGVKTIPGVREAIELKRWKEAETEIVRVAAALQLEANVIESTARDLDAQPTK